MDMAQVKTRARTALGVGASATSPKRRKIAINNNSNNISPSSCVQLKSLSNTTSRESEECCSGESPASCCSSNGSFDENRIIKFSDLEVENAQVETSTCNFGEQQMRREMSSDLRITNSQEVNSEEKKPTMQTKTKPRCYVPPAPQKMPAESELEEFFAAAEKDIQKRFSEKYNYDIVKDMPLEGRYEWVKLKP
ncbi:cyclin-dependent kinase inhibitor 7 [Vigna radiata var. radiata]|uniref:Cyclin-dependent kinase inhibitor n=1 Tax=Vigna radiata var. radiata TaxID=3916 RepID=A0A1S3UJ11_VIGRR|nr:cyclin-dependent kinase inhibitor 7 [Vigna radiata var. radiata]